MKGIIVFRRTNVGSKSEGMFPFLYLGNGEFVRVLKNGDVSFDGSALREFDGKCVALEGSLGENDIFFADSVTVCNPKEETETQTAED